jgi:hypothetical protein
MAARRGYTAGERADRQSAVGKPDRPAAQPGLDANLADG